MPNPIILSLAPRPEVAFALRKLPPTAAGRGLRRLGPAQPGLMPKLGEGASSLRDLSADDAGPNRYPIRRGAKKSGFHLRHLWIKNSSTALQRTPRRGLSPRPSKSPDAAPTKGDRSPYAKAQTIPLADPNGPDPSLDDFADIADAALNDIPEEFKRHIQGVALRIDDLPDDATLRQMNIHHPLGLLGLYRGVPFGKRETFTVIQHIDLIFLYRQPILAHWRRSGGSLEDLVRHVLVHEIGHHFGLSDRDMARIEREN